MSSAKSYTSLQIVDIDTIPAPIEPLHSLRSKMSISQSSLRLYNPRLKGARSANWPKFQLPHLEPSRDRVMPNQQHERKPKTALRIFLASPSDPRELRTVSSYALPRCIGPVNRTRVHDAANAINMGLSIVKPRLTLLVKLWSLSGES